MQQATPIDMEARKRKMLLLLPLFILPFVVLLFYSLKGGKPTEVKAEQKGINQDLPQPQVNDSKQRDKLSLYREAEKDSVRRATPTRDPFASLALTADTPLPASPFAIPPVTTDLLHRPNGAPQGTRSNLADNERKVEARLATLQQMVSNARQSEAAAATAMPSNPASPLSSFPGLPQGVAPGAADSPQGDPELKQLNDMLEKVLDVQHPERVRDRMLETSTKAPTKVFAVNPATDERTSGWQAPPDTTADKKALRRRVKAAGRFFELDQETSADDMPNTIPAVVHETRTLVSGASIKLRLTSAIVIRGHEIPVGTTVDGIAELSGERLKVTIDKIITKGTILPVKLEAYDPGGLAGIPVPGAISRDAGKEGADQAIQSMQLATLNPSLGAQAAAQGMETVKTFLSKKVRRITVTVKAGTPVLLYSAQNGQ